MANRTPGSETGSVRHAGASIYIYIKRLKVIIKVSSRSLHVEIEHVPIGSRHFQHRCLQGLKHVRPEVLQRRDRTRQDSIAWRHIVPAQHKLAVRAQVAVARRERFVRMFQAVEPPAQHTIADDDVEIVVCNVVAQLLQVVNDMPLGAMATPTRNRIDRPVFMRSEPVCVRLRVSSAANKEHALACGALCKGGQDDLLQHSSVLGSA